MLAARDVSRRQIRYTLRYTQQRGLMPLYYEVPVLSFDAVVIRRYLIADAKRRCVTRERGAEVRR